LGVREVFAVSLEDVVEVHLHPGDMRGAIVSLSETRPPSSWRWGGPNWGERAAPALVSGATVSLEKRATERWRTIIGGQAGLEYADDRTERGLIEVKLDGQGQPTEIGGVRFVFQNSKEER